MVNISAVHMSHIETGYTKLSLPVLTDIRSPHSFTHKKSRQALTWRLFLMRGGSKMIFSKSADQFRMVCSVSMSNRWTLCGSNATRTVSPLRALEVGATRAVILLPLYSRYR